MSKFHIQKLSKAQQNKLMSGGSVRITEGEIPMIVHPSRIKEITRKFKKGVGHSLSLSPEELHHNLNMEGGGPLGDMAKRVVKTGIRYAAPIGKTMARTAIGTGSAMLAAAQPELIPFIPAGAMALTAASDHFLITQVDMQINIYLLMMINMMLRITEDLTIHQLKIYKTKY